MKLLIYCNKFDETDDLFGFFPSWVYALLSRFEKVIIATPQSGQFKECANLSVNSLGARQSVFKRLLKFYFMLFQKRREYDAAFFLMAPNWLVGSKFILSILGKESILWYAVWKKTLKLKLAAWLADRIVTSVPEAFPFRTPKLSVVGQGVDTDFFKPDPSLQKKNDFLFVGRISPIKKLGLIVEQVVQLDDFKLNIIGSPANDGDEKYLDKIKRTVSLKGAENKVIFHGKIEHDKILPFYQNSEFFVNLTPTGSFDKTTLEAMASGCIILSANLALKRFLSRELSEKLIIEPNKIAKKIETIKNLSDIEKDEIKKQLRQAVLENHSLDKMIPKLAKALKGEESKMPILITGFPYAFPYYFRVFEYFKNKENLFFILPKYWQARHGKIKIRLEPKMNFNIFGARAISFGGRSLFWKLGGLFKGFMPAVLYLIPFYKFKYGVKTVYHCSEPHLLTTFLIALVTKLAGMNYICFTWQNVAPGKRLRGLKLHLSLILTKVILHLSDGVICGNGKAQEIISSLSRAKTIVAPIAGIDVDKFRPVPGRVQTGNLTILFYGALDYRKGIDILIRAFAEIRGRFDACKLLIVGAGPEKDNLKKLAGSLDLGERIEFRDWVKNEELPEIIRGSSVFVYPSRPAGGWEEQFGYAIAEASACGLPVISTKSGSINEVIIDDKSGILVEPDNVGDLARALEELIANIGERTQMGGYGRKYIVENFSHQVIAGRIGNFLNGF